MELLVVITVIGLLATAGVLTFNKVNRQHRASTIVSDIGQIQISLAAYKGDLKVYPQNLVGGAELRGTGATTSTIYMAEVPVPPTIKDGDCADYPMYNSYYYVPSSDFKNYCLFFCLPVDAGDLTAGAKVLKPSGIGDATLGQVNACVGRNCGDDGCGNNCGTCQEGG